MNPNSIPQPQPQTCSLSSLLSIATTWQIRHVGAICQSLGNLPCGIDTTDLDEAVPSLCNSLADDVRTFGLTLCTDDVCLAFLLGALDNEPGTLGVLLGDAELLCTPHQVRADAVRDRFSLGDELGGVELRDDGLEDFVAD